ncbi:efflux RND transporter periplasmic adaptor subunit [Asticcacaulis excentricus]|nr:efflux RND transporter periplasmic adaptor subunit [Asticcacaulis excentricus]
MAALLAACHASPKAETDAPTRVLTYMVRASNGSGTAYAGTIKARVEQTIAFRVGGKIIERKINVGDHVSPGQLLMRLDPTDYNDGLEAAMATVAAARSAAVRANANYERVNSLAASGSISVDTTEQARAAKDSADANLKAAEAQLATIKNQRAYTELRADVAGVVVEIPGEAGMVTAAGQPVIRIAQSGAPEAVVGLPEAGHAVGEVAQATVFGSNNATYTARLRQVSLVADPATRLFEARYVLDAALTDAPLGSTVRVTPAGAKAVTAAMDVPLSALVDKGQGTRVWIIDAQGKVRARPVTVARLNEETASIASGLTQGDVVVAAGAQLLSEGQAVQVIRGGVL